MYPELHTHRESNPAYKAGVGFGAIALTRDGSASASKARTSIAGSHCAREGGAEQFFDGPKSNGAKA
jgi:hypothetical protein